MFHSQSLQRVQIVGVALAGRRGNPIAVLRAPESGDFLSLPLSAFDAETLIKDHVGEEESCAVSWLEDMLRNDPPRFCVLEVPPVGEAFIRFTCSGSPFPEIRRLGAGEGMALARRLSVPVFARDSLFSEAEDELRWLTRNRVFTGDFLYLTPPQYAPTIPVV